MKRITFLIVAMFVISILGGAYSAQSKPVYFIKDYTKPAKISFEFNPVMTCWFKLSSELEWKKYGKIYNGEPLVFYAVKDGIYEITGVTNDKAPVINTEPDAFVYVDTIAPIIEIISPLEGEIYSGNQPIKLMWKINDAIPVNRKALVEVGNVLKDGSVKWSTVSKKADANPLVPMNFQPEKAGINKLKFRISIIDSAMHFAYTQHKSPIFIDNVAPETNIGRVDIDKSEITVHYQYNDTGDSPMKKINLQYRLAGTSTWRLLKSDEDNISPIYALLPTDGRFELKTEATDIVDNKESKTEADAKILIDTTQPKLRFTSMRESNEYIAGQKVEIAGMINDLNLDDDSVSLFFSPNNGKSWETLNGDPIKIVDDKFSYNWTVPEFITTEARLKVRAADYSGYTAELLNPAPFVINLRKTPEAVITGVRTVSGGVEFSYQILGLGTREAEAIELWKGEFVNDNWVWKQADRRKITDPKAEFGTIDYQAATANLGFAVRFIPKTGTTETTLEKNSIPEAFFKGFVPIPRAFLNTLASVNLLKGGENFSLGWNAITTQECKLDIDYSANDGKDWKAVKHDIEIPKTGGQGQTLWTLPEGTHPRVMLRLSMKVEGFAGTAYTYCDVPVKIDGQAPTGRLMKPAAVKIYNGKRVCNAEIIEFPHNISDIGLAGLKELELWANIDNAAPVLLKKFKPGDPIKYQVPADGVHTMIFKVIARDNLDNVSLAKNSFMITVDRKAPVVSLENFNTAGAFLSDSLESIEWNATDMNLLAEPVEIYMRKNAKSEWELIAGPMKNTGSLNWHLPRFLVTQECQLKIVVKDENGNEGFAVTSQAFDVSVHGLPTATAFGPTSSAGGIDHNMKVNYQLKFSEKTQAIGVDLFVTNNGGRTYNFWRRVTDLNNEINFVPPASGFYGFVCVAFDNRGFMENIPVAGDKPEVTANVQLDNDVSPCSFRFMPNRDVYSQGDEILLRWFLRGDSPIEESVQVQVSGDAGVTWKVLDNAKAKGECKWAPKTAGKFLVRIKFTDLFGQRQSIVKLVTVK